jgi:hypothetical protein
MAFPQFVATARIQYNGPTFSVQEHFVSDVFKRLNLNGQAEIVALDAQAGFEPVRQVAIAADWSALRFRRVETIKKLTRSSLGAISQASQQQIAAREKDTIA